MASYETGYHRTQDSTSGTFQDRPSFDSGAARTSRLQKQRSNVGMRHASHGQAPSNAGQTLAVLRGHGMASGGFGDGAKARKPSIRNTVRKIFGRRQRDTVSPNPEAFANPPAARHTYHMSEPTALVSPKEEPEPYMENADFIERTLSDRYQAIPSPPFNRTGSPYAVQFPNSVRLKPMDLGNPFIAGPNQIKRRKTLPDMVESEPPAESSRDFLEADLPAAIDLARILPGRSVQRTPSQIKKSRRKSRSTDDLKGSNSVEDGPLRKRSEEIKYWRESFEPDVLRASGFTARADELKGMPSKRTPRSVREEAVEERAERTPIPQQAESFSRSVVSGSDTLRSSPPFQHTHGLSIGEGDFRPTSGAGTELSNDLEDRVAKLEAGLQNFQQSLQRLTAERNRRTVIMGGSITTRRSSTDMRTPSLLADTLADPLEVSSYQYEYGHTMRPSTSPKAPAPPPALAHGGLEDPFGPEILTPPMSDEPTRSFEDTFRMPSPLQSHPPTQQPPAPSSSTPRGQPQPYTFSSLYQMLADERSARRKLELQLRGLKQEISDLHTQVASSPNMQSARSSYMIAGSSTRLQELLRETESSPGTAAQQSSPQRDSGLPAGGTPITSRFSGSESEAASGAAEYEELATPHEAYQTPREMRSKHSLTGNPSLDADELEMF